MFGGRVLRDERSDDNTVGQSSYVILIHPIISQYAGPRGEYVVRISHADR